MPVGDDRPRLTGRHVYLPRPHWDAVPRVPACPFCGSAITSPSREGFVLGLSMGVWASLGAGGSPTFRCHVCGRTGIALYFDDEAKRAQFEAECRERASADG